MKPTSSRSQHHVDVVRKLRPQLEELADEIEASDNVPPYAYQLLTDSNLLRLTLPQEWEGQGLTVAEAIPVLQEVAKISGALRMVVHGQNVTWRMVEQWGTPDQKATWLPVHRAGGLFTFGLTEPDNGTGRDISTAAVRDGDQWVINGRKHLITWGGSAELVHLMAATGKDDQGGSVVTCFLLPKGTAGVTTEHLPSTMGCKGVPHDVMVFDNCRLPAEAVLGEIGQGLQLGLRGFLDISRLSIAISSLGLSIGAFELAVEFAKHRVTFGKAIATRQAVKLAIAEMGTDIYVLDQAVMAAANKYDRGESIEVEAAMCKLMGIDVVSRVTDRALGIHGGIGYTGAHRIERHYRDARALWFEEGTAEIQKIVAAGHLIDSGITW